MPERSINEKNGIIVALFIFQYALLAFVMAYVSSSLVIAASSLLLIATLIVINGFAVKIDFYVILTSVSIIILLTIKVIFGSEVNVIISFIEYALPCALILSYPFSEKKTIETCMNIATVNFAITALIPFIQRFDYMRFGYAMLPSMIFLYMKVTSCQGSYELWYRNKIIDCLLIITGNIEILAFGNRGALFAFGLFFIMYEFVYNKRISYKKVLIIIVIAFVITNLPSILNVAAKQLNRFGISSRSVSQFGVQLEKGFDEASSGRSGLYKRAIEEIKQNPVFGSKIIMDQEKQDYFHNLFLQLLHDTGLVGLIPLVCLLVKCIEDIRKNRNGRYSALVVLALFSIAIGRLMFSSTLWLRPEFWLLTFYAVKKKTVQQS